MMLFFALYTIDWVRAKFYYGSLVLGVCFFLNRRCAKLGSCFVQAGHRLLAAADDEFLFDLVNTFLLACRNSMLTFC
jgi:hypothetical protein